MAANVVMKMPRSSGNSNEGEGQELGVLMTTTNNTVRFQTPAWADPELTQIEHEEGEPDAVRFAASIDGVEFNQWCDEKEGELTVTDGPYVTTHRLPTSMFCRCRKWH
ncbi:hypothetical protein HR12_45690, partial [Microbacterium sp. SUBG005]